MSQRPISLAAWPVAILAGGFATRLRPATETMPKALLKVAGEPFIIHQLRLLHAAGFNKIVLCLGYLGEQIESLLRDGGSLGLQISYAFDGEKLLGTGGALKQALGQLGDQFVVLYGDSYLPVNYRAIVAAFIGCDKPALMTIFRNEGLWDTSNVSFEAGRIRSYSKKAHTPQMKYIDYGIGVLRAKVFAAFADQKTFDLADLYSHLVQRGQLAGFEVKQRFYEIGSAAGLAELDTFLREKAAKVSI